MESGASYPLETDMYAIARALRAFPHNKEKHTTVFYGGSAHTDIYTLFFKYIGATEIYSDHDESMCSVRLTDELRGHLGLSRDKLFSLSPIKDAGVLENPIVSAVLNYREFADTGMIERVVNYIKRLPQTSTTERQFKAMMVTRTVAKLWYGFKNTFHNEETAYNLLLDSDINILLSNTLAHPLYPVSLLGIIQQNRRSLLHRSFRGYNQGSFVVPTTHAGLKK